MRLLGVVVLSILSLFLFVFLADHSASMLSWECETLDGMLRWHSERPGIIRYVLRSVVWDDAPLSGGHSSILFGAPVYTLWHFANGSIFNFRVVSALLPLIALALFIIGVPRTGSPALFIAFGVLLASHPVTVYYAAYGVATSGLIVAQAFLLAFVFRYLRKPSASSIFAIVFSAFMLTLTYAPGRLAALGTLGGLAMILLLRCAQGPNRRIALMHFSFAAIITLVIGVTEWFAGGTGFFLNARGEQVLAWRDGSGNLVLNERPDRARRSVAEFAETVVSSRVQELGKVLSPKPLMRERPSTPAELGDPPELPYLNYGSLFFITLGICLGVVRYRQHLFVILMQVLVTLMPLLFTTRIDAHRVLPLLVPMQISLAIGATELCEWIRFRRPSVAPSSWFSVPLVAGLVGTQILSVSSYLRPRGALSPVARTVQAVIQKSKAQSIGIYGPGYCGAQYTAFPLAFSQLLQGQRQKVQFHSGDPTALLAAAHEQMVRDKRPELSVVVGVTPEAVAALPTRASSVFVTYIHDGVGVLTQSRN